MGAEAVRLTIQIHWNDQWHDAAVVSFLDPSKGLRSSLRATYRPEYVARALDAANWPEDQVLGGAYALGVNLPVRFDATYEDGVVAAVLRDIIPQGFGRRRMLEHLGYRHDPGPRADLPLLAHGCVAPVGNLRVKAAAEAFAAKLDTARVPRFTKDEVIGLGEGIIDDGIRAGVPVAAALGAGGEAPKVLLVEDRAGRFALEGTLGDDEIHGHWLVKFPRGRKSSDDVAVLEGEAAVYQVLSARGINTLSGTTLKQEGPSPSLWLPRFDREGGNRFGVESVYSVMGMIGDGAALDHFNVAGRLVAATDNDTVLVDYLVQDVVNTVIGNVDNHGRNVALRKTQKETGLAPYYDLAPMVLDPEGLSRATRWPSEYMQGGQLPAYGKVLEQCARDPVHAKELFAVRVDRLRDLGRVLADVGAPDRMLRHSGVRLEFAEQVHDALL